AVDDRGEHGAERAARLVDDGRRHPIAVHRPAEDEGGVDRLPCRSQRSLARRLRDAAPARVDGQTAAAATPARTAVELHRRVADLAAEPAGPAHETSVEDNPGAESRARGEDDERLDAAGRTERPLGERERVDVVVDEDGNAEASGEQRGERSIGELGDVMDLRADAAAVRID